jgi:hypothetical protein
MQDAPPDEERPGRSGGMTSPTVRLIAGVGSGAGVIVLLLALGAPGVITRSVCARPVIVNVAASLDIAPAVQRIGAYFNSLNRNVDGRCAEVEVTEESAQQVAGQLPGKTSAPGQDHVDAWVPDSSLWVDIVRSSPAGAAAVRETGVSVARSPLVVAVPRPVSHVLTSTVSPASWPSLLRDAASGRISAAGLSLQLPDPAEDAAGLATLVEARRVFSASPDPGGELAKLARGADTTTPFNSVPALADFASQAQFPGVKPMTITSEQAVESYNRANPGTQLGIAYPSGDRQATGPDYDLDYPVTIISADSLKVLAAQQFSQVLRSSVAASDVRQLGFRSADGQADPSAAQYGVRTDAPAAMPAASPGEAQGALQQWKQLDLGSRELVLNDVSAATGRQIGSGSMTQMSMLEQAAGLGLELFPDSTQMGAWAYSDHMDGAKPYKVEIPMGPLPQQLGLISRRQQLQQLTKTLVPVPAAPAAMYSSVLAAFRWMTSNYVHDDVNALIVLGSGTESAPDDISLSQLLTGLRRSYDPHRPVEILAVSAGNTADLTALNEITAITKGASFVVRQPSDIDTAFFESIGRRICDPNCG